MSKLASIARPAEMPAKIRYNIIHVCAHYTYFNLYIYQTKKTFAM